MCIGICRDIVHFKLIAKLFMCRITRQDCWYLTNPVNQILFKPKY